MNKKILSLVFILILLVTIILGCNSIYNNKSFEEGNQKFIKAVHYFGDEAPMNFWSSDLSNIDMDLKKIKEDGFNSIILVIPWREYQPKIDPISYNKKIKERLHFVINKASKYDLDVIVRVGYAWDYYYNGQFSCKERFSNIFSEEKFLKAFIDFTGDVYKEVSKHENFDSGFITWEDFWFISYLDGNSISYEENLRLANKIGFSKYLKENYTIKELENKYGYTINNFNEVYIPGRDEYAFVLYYQFLDHFIIDNILEPCQKVFPELTLETRFDMEPIKYGKTYKWFAHKYMYKVKNTPMVGTIYGVSMGFENDGRRKYASANEVLNKFKYYLNSWSEELYPGQKLFIDQFLFYDNTPGFENNIAVKPDELGKFILNSENFLKKYTSGYAIWTYKNYKANLLYNNGFEIGKSGWQLLGDALVENKKQNNYVYLDENSKIRQKVKQKHFYNLTNDLFVEFNAKSSVPLSKIKITVGSFEQIIDITDTNWQSYKIQLANNEYKDFSNLQIEVLEGELEIDNIKLYSFIQDGKLYNSNNEELEMIKYIRKLNDNLPNRYEQQKVIYDSKSVEDEDWNIKFKTGFYEKEKSNDKEQVWMNRYGKILINKNNTFDKVKIKAYVPLENLKKANSNEEVILEIYSVDKKIEEKHLKKDGEIEIVINKKDLSLINGNYVIELIMNSSFVPNDISDSQDVRELSLLISSLLLDKL
ncbi:MAG: hypothetical protein JG764_1617 [Clostridiales bacterium]|jgi:hypothetical protein|nr:hypothetical protein [Clostridiales bacterium]